MFRFILLALLTLRGCWLLAQEPPCGIRTIQETVSPFYPPIGRAAHVSGTVVLLATFDLNGSVTTVHAVSGPMLLREPAETFVKGWKADVYTGPRSCPVIVEYVLAGGVWCTDDQAKETKIPDSGRIDTQHFRIGGNALALCDPAAYIGKRKRRFGIF